MLNDYIDVSKLQRRTIPEPVFEEGAIPLWLERKKALVVNGINENCQKEFLGLIDKLDYEPLPTNNLRNAVSIMGQGIDALITDYILNESPIENKEELLKVIHKNTQIYAREATLILYSATKPKNVEKFRKPKVHYISTESSLDRVKELIAPLLIPQEFYDPLILNSL